MRGSTLQSIIGAWRLFLWDPRGMERFDLTTEGFWRSFSAPIAMLPAYYFILMQNAALASILLEQNPDAIELTIPSLSHYLTIEMIAYVISIAVFPVAMVFLARQLGLSNRYIPLIVAYNWSSVIVIGALALSLMAFSLGIFSVMLAGGLMALTILVWPFYLFSIVRIATQAPLGTSIALVLIELILSYSIGTIAAAL